MNPSRIVILDDDYMASQSLANAADSFNISSLKYASAAVFYEELGAGKFSSSDLFILDLMLRNEGLPANLLNSDAQTGQIVLRVLRERIPTALIYVVTAWTLRSDDPHQSSKYADRIYSKPCRYKKVINDLMREASEMRRVRS